MIPENNNTITCRIGLISHVSTYHSTENIKQADLYLVLGEIFDQDMRANPTTLYELHQNLKYLSPFKARISTERVWLNNTEEIFVFQIRYKMTRKVRAINNREKKSFTRDFTAPQLYDLTCMVPLFTDKVERSIFTQNEEVADMITVFVIFPYQDPILRGQIIDRCFQTSVPQGKICFLTVGDLSGSNRVPTCEFSRDYLLSCRVPYEDIFLEKYDKFPECIPELINMIEFIFSAHITCTIVFAVARKDMNLLLSHIRNLRHNDTITQKIQLLCEM